MMHAWTALFAAASVVSACWGAGVLLLSQTGSKLNRIEAIPLEFLTGACGLQLAIFVIMAAKIGYKPVFLVLLGVCMVAGAVGHRPSGPLFSEKSRLLFLFISIFSIWSVILLVNAWVPETSPDGSGYHLEIVSQYLHAHGFRQLPDNMYSALGQGIELLYAPAVAFGGFSAAALVHFSFLVALAWLVFAYGARIGKPLCGAAAALLVAFSPVVARNGTTAYIDVAVAAVVFAVFYWLEIWDSTRDSRLLVPAGLLAGYAYAAKYTAAAIAVYAIALVAVRARRWRPPLLLAACSALVIAPWMLKDWIYFHNPVAPFANGIFPNPYIHVEMEQQWAEWLRRYDLPKFQQLPLEVTVRGNYTQGILGPVFLLAPLALLGLRRPEGWRLLLPGLIMIGVYFGNIGTRFLIPALPFFSLGIALAIENRWLLTALVLAHVVLSSPGVIPRYANQYTIRIEHFPWREALRLVPEDAYVRRNVPDLPILQMINQYVPPGERVFANGDLAWFAYSQREIVDHFRGALGNTLWEILFTGWKESTDPLRLLVFKFPEIPATRIRLLQTAHAQKDQDWMIHELHFFDRGAEVPRRREWRLRAWPNPFEVQLAFDHSRATRWRTWQTAGPGMYVDVDFGRAEPVDEVRMETSTDPAWPLQLRVEKWEQNRWIALTDRFAERPNQVTGAIRRAATYELARRGVHYILVGESDFGAQDFYDDPAEWGLREVAHVPRAVLYRTLP